jgi:hypothetical protein
LPGIHGIFFISLQIVALHPSSLSYAVSAVTGGSQAAAVKVGVLLFTMVSLKAHLQRPPHPPPSLQMGAVTPGEKLGTL